MILSRFSSHTDLRLTSGPNLILNNNNLNILKRSYQYTQVGMCQINWIELSDSSGQIWSNVGGLFQNVQYVWPTTSSHRINFLQYGGISPILCTVNLI